MTLTDELLPCPFCGFEDCMSHPPSETGAYLSRVSCPNCETLGPERLSEPHAIAAWNRRAGLAAIPREPTQAMIDAARKEHDKFKLVHYQSETVALWTAMYDAARGGKP